MKISCIAFSQETLFDGAYSRINSLCSLIIWHSRCRILRLPCKIEASFDVSAKDRALTNNVIKSYTVKNLQQCFDKCTDDHNDCKSVNHKQLGSHNCQLNNKIKEETKTSNFVIKEYWTYYSTNYSTKYVRCTLLDSSLFYKNS